MRKRPPAQFKICRSVAGRPDHWYSPAWSTKAEAIEVARRASSDYGEAVYFEIYQVPHLSQGEHVALVTAGKRRRLYSAAQR